MTLRAKLIIVLVAVSATATAFIGAASYVSTRRELTQSIDDSLRAAAVRLIDSRVAPPGRGPQDSDGDGDGDGATGLERIGRGFEGVLVQRLDRTGSPVASTADLPVVDADRAVARGDRREERRDIDLGDEPYRLLTVPAPDGALQLARSTASNEAALDAVLRRTLLLVAIVIAAASAVGWLLTRQLTRRLTALAAAAGAVASTGRLDVDIPADGRDEAAQVGHALRDMLQALETSRRQQQQLVQDAGHELRTPLTSLRTNVSVLARYDDLPDDSRRRLLDDLSSETRELTELVNELVELATDRRAEEPVGDVALGDIVERVAERAIRRSGREVIVRHDGAVVRGRPGALERAVSNLVDNAIKFAPQGPIEVTVAAAAHPTAGVVDVSVRDHGPGIAPADQARVFERFYRSDEARSLPGSGLGLAIVASVAELHGGVAYARDAVSGPGAVIGFTVAGA